MSTIDSSSSAAYSAASTRAELATNAVRDQNAQERQVASLLERAQDADETRRREVRDIPGLGRAVDISV